MGVRIRALLLGGVALAVSAASSSGLTGQIVGNSVRITNATLTTCEPHTWRFSQPDAPFVSVHFSKFRVSDSDIVTIATLDNATSKRVEVPAGTTSFSSDRIPGPTAVVTFTPVGCLAQEDAKLPSDFGLQISAFEYTLAESYSSVGEDREICGTGDQNKAAVCFKHATNVSSQVYANARAIARLLISSGSDGPQVACTGFLLGSNGHLVTNHHCIKDADQANRTNFEFMVESPTCDTTSCRQLGDCAQYGKVESYGAEFLYANEKYDYAVVKLRKKPCVVNGKYGFLKLRKAKPVEGEPIYIVQHPSGGGKMITTQQDLHSADDDDDDNDDDDPEPDDGDEDDDDATTKKQAGSKSSSAATEQAVVAAVDDENQLGSFWTSYYADTQGGSSGSPVLSLNTHTVLALHANGACKNSGAPSYLIIEDMEKNNLDLPDDAFA